MLQNTLVEVEASSGVTPDDPALLALKSVVLRRIAHLELANAEVTEEIIATQTPPPVAAVPPAVEVGQTASAVPLPNGDGPPMAVVPPANEVAPAVASAPPANEAAPARLEISPQEPNQETTSRDSGGSAGSPRSPEQTDPGKKPS